MSQPWRPSVSQPQRPCLEPMLLISFFSILNYIPANYQKKRAYLHWFTPFLHLVVHAPARTAQRNVAGLWGDVAWHLAHCFLLLILIDWNCLLTDWWFFFTGGGDRSVLGWPLVQWLPVLRLLPNQLLHCWVNALLFLFWTTLEWLYFSRVCTYI